MADTADIFGRVLVRSNADERDWSATVSDRTILESSIKKILLASNAIPVEVDLGSFGDDTGPKGVHISTDLAIHVYWGNTETSNLGTPLAADGMLVALVTGANSSHLAIKSAAGITADANVNVGVWLFSTA